jgi:hypothetical protein
MFFSGRVRRQPRNVAGRRSLGLRCRPAVEILEDRSVPSAAPDPLAPPTSPPAAAPPAQVSLDSISAIAGLPVTGIIARFTGAAPVSAQITWGDGHSSAGSLAAVTDGYAVFGSNTYSSAGTYHVSVTVLTAAGDEITGQANATVVVVLANESASAGLPGSYYLFANGSVSTTTLRGSGITSLFLGASGNSGALTLTPDVVWSVSVGPVEAGGAHGSTSVPPPGTTPVLIVQAQPFAGSGRDAPAVAFSGLRPAPIAVLEQVPWTPVHEYGGNRAPVTSITASLLPVAPVGSLALGRGRDAWSTGTQASAPPSTQLATTLARNRLDPHRSLLLSSLVQNTAMEEVRSESPLLFSFDLAESPEKERVGAVVTVSAPPTGTPGAETYLRPLDQFAERGDLVCLIDLPGTVYVPASGFSVRNRGMRGGVPAETLAASPQTTAASSSRAGRFARLGRTLLPFAATWAIFQAMYTGIVRTSGPARRRDPKQLPSQ